MSYGKILSIQSHVVHGHVGNKAAVFPLQVNNAKKIVAFLCYKFNNLTPILKVIGV